MKTEAANQNMGASIASSRELVSRPTPPTLLLLLVVLILQISVCSTVGVLQLAQGYIGFDNKRVM